MPIYRIPSRNILLENNFRDKENYKNRDILLNIMDTSHGPRVKIAKSSKGLKRSSFSSFPVLRENDKDEIQNDIDFDSTLNHKSAHIVSDSEEYSHYAAGFAVYARKEILNFADAREKGDSQLIEKTKDVLDDKVNEYGRKIGSYKNTSMIRRVANAEREKRLKSI